MKTHRRHEFVYVLVFPNTNEVKVGLSSVESFGHRLRAIRTMRAGQDFYLLKTISGNRATERSLHRILRPWRIGGEWFDWRSTASFLHSLSGNWADRQLQLPVPGAAPRSLAGGYVPDLTAST